MRRERTREPPQTSDPTLKQQLEKLRAAFIHEKPFCHGIAPLPLDDFVLFYGKGAKPTRRINLANATPDELQHLAETCDPASFGVGQKDVYDESYRKAGKLDKADFAINLSPEALGIVDAINNALFVESLGFAEDSIRTELYKLNVYGPQSFFKPHVDTPRSKQMFGSLVIVFPTPHEGGALVLRDDHDASKDIEGGGSDPQIAANVTSGRREWTVDSGTLLAQRTEPSIAYVAFFSDTEHEVMPVLSGYRVTLTYNLYAIPKGSVAGGGAEPGPPAAESVSALSRPVKLAEQTLRSTLESLLGDPTFLPRGGNLLFGLYHRYPVPTDGDTLQKIAPRLNGSDAILWQVAHGLSLDTIVKMVYHDEETYEVEQSYVMCDHDVPLDRWGEIHGCIKDIMEGKPVIPDADDPTLQVHWVGTSPWRSNAEKQAYVTYGNQPCITHTYWRFALLVPVGPYGQRATRNEGGQ
ncbi:hypothetical protein GY45DRAFT_1318758 [Cubamyces sp. BRFM 1775]|nr:hypothetical protein GY45DRAFT_1318758 [Cubamyces sp. BRFM 1775]